MRSAAKNFFLLSSSEIISKALGFLTTVVIARRVGVDGLGDIGFVLAVYTYFTFLANPGYDIIGARETVRKDIDVSKIINSIFVLKFWSSILAFLLLLLFCIIVPFSASVKQLLMLQGLSLLTIPFAFQFFFRGGNQMHIVSLSRLMQSGMYFISVFIGVNGISDITRVPIAFGISTVIGFIPMLGLIREHCSLHLKVKKEQMRSLFSASLMVGAAVICTQIYLNMDVVLLGIFRTQYEVGLYVSAYKVVTFATTIPILIFTAYMPSLEIKRADFELQWNRYKKSMIYFGIPIGFSIGIFAPYIVQSLYGTSYIASVIPLRILSVNIIIVFFSVMYAQPLLLFGKERQYLFIVAAGALANLLPNLIIIPLYGMTGAAITTTLSEGVVAVSAWKVLKSELIKIRKEKVLLESIVNGKH